MGAFLSPLDVRQRGRRTWMTLAPVVYVSDIGPRITVPAEFITDLASVPRLPLAYLIAGDRARGPAVIHDWLYQSPTWEDRPLADSILLEAMACEQPELGYDSENFAIRGLIYSAVRTAGGIAWASHGKRAAALNPIWHREGFPETV